MASPTRRTKTFSSRRGQGVGTASEEPVRQPKVAQVLPNNNHPDESHHQHYDPGMPRRYSSNLHSPSRQRVMSPRARVADGSEDVVPLTDGPQDFDDPCFHYLDMENTLNQTDMIPNTTLMEIKDPKRIPAQNSPKRSPHKSHPSQVSQHSQLSQHSLGTQHSMHLQPSHHQQYAAPYGGTQRIPSVHHQSGLPEYSDYPGPPKVGPGTSAKSAGYPVSFHTKLNLANWQENLDTQLQLQHQMQHLKINPLYHPSEPSGAIHGLQIRHTGAAYPAGDSTVGLGMIGADSTNMEGVIRAKENMLHERNIVLERQKLEIAHLQKQIQEHTSISNQRHFVRSRDDNDVLFLKMQEYQYEIASLRAQLAEVSTAKMAETEQLSRKLGEVESSQQTNEKTIADLKKQLRQREMELDESRAQVHSGKTSYEKLKKKIGKMERYMHDLPTVEEYRASSDTIKELHQQEQVLRERVGQLEASLTKAKDKARRRQQEASDLENKNTNLQLHIDSMKKEMGRLHRALGSKETGEPTDLELCSKGDITQLREENRRHSSNIEQLKKAIDSKHKQLQKVQAGHQRALQEAESRLEQEEGVITALRLEMKSKEHSLQEMTRSMKELASQSQELYDHNLSLQESVHTLERAVASDRSRLTAQLVKELTSCVQELQQLVELCSQRAEGQEPNVSLLLGFRPSSAVPFDHESDAQSTSEDGLKARLTQVQKLRGDIDFLRSLISDKYAEDVGSNCVTQ